MKKTKEYLALSSLVIIISILIMVGSSTQIVGTSLENNLTAYYKLDGTAGNVTDSHIYQNNATNNGTTRGVEGKINKSFNFSGSGQFVNIPTGVDFTTNFTLNAWVNTTSLVGNRPIIGCNESNGYSLFTLSGELYLTKCDVDSVGSSHTLGVGSWEMVTLVHNGTTALFYINATSVSNVSYVQTFSSGMAYNIGAYTSTDYFAGQIDEVSFFNTTLSTTEIQELWNNGDGLPYSVDTINPNVTIINPENKTYRASNVTFNINQ